MNNVYEFPKKNKESISKEKNVKNNGILKNFFISAFSVFKLIFATTIEYIFLGILLLANRFKNPVMVLGMAYVFYYVQSNYNHILDGNYMYPLIAFLIVIFVAISGNLALTLERYHPFHRLLNVGVMKR